MSFAYSTRLLDEALGMRSADAAAASSAGRRVVLVEDCVETSGAFVLHHLLKRALTHPGSKEAVVFLALAQTFSHYDRVLRKLGCNLSTQRDKKKFHLFELLDFQGGMSNASDDIQRNDCGTGFAELYSKIHRVVETCFSPEYNMDSVTIMIDDISLLEIAAHGSADSVLNFIHYCVTLTSEADCSLIVLNHEDIYSDSGAPKLLSCMEYLADTIIRTEPLPTGLSSDVHGQLTVVNKYTSNSNGVHCSSKMAKFHFKVKENGVEYFNPGRVA